MSESLQIGRQCWWLEASVDHTAQHTTGDQEWTSVVVENGREQINEEQMLRPPAEEFLSEI